MSGNSNVREKRFLDQINNAENNNQRPVYYYYNFHYLT